METPTTVFTFTTVTRRSLLTLFMAFAMLWAISVGSFAWSGEPPFGGYGPPICTEGCLQSITWE